MKNTDLKTQLQRFTGTSDNWHFRTRYPAFLYTDGVNFLAEHADACWLIDRILNFQYGEFGLRRESAQVWDLIRNEDDSAWLIATDGNGRHLFRETIAHMSIPLSEVRLFLADHVLMLASESI